MSEVYFLRITRDDLIRDPQRLSVFASCLEKNPPRKNDLVGLKVHFGEKGNKSYINPRSLSWLVKHLRQQGLKPFLFDTNTLYRGQRLNSVDHISLAQQHGFAKLNIPIIIGDGLRGSDMLEVEVNKKHFKTCFIASILKDTDYLISLSHFTLHMLSGFGATLKNLGMGCASRKGKMQQHCEVSPHIEEGRCIVCGACAANCPVACIEQAPSEKYRIKGKECIGCAQCISMCPQDAVKINWSESYNLLQEKMLEYSLAVVKNRRAAYVNFCSFITKECDCMNTEEAPFVPDLGVFFSFDPLAVDKASLDVLLSEVGRDFVKEVHPEIDYLHQFQYAEAIGLGSSNYTLIEL